MDTGESHDKVKKMLDDTCVNGVEQMSSRTDVKMMLILIGKAGGTKMDQGLPALGTKNLGTFFWALADFDLACVIVFCVKLFETSNLNFCWT